MVHVDMYVVHRSNKQKDQDRFRGSIVSGWVAWFSNGASRVYGSRFYGCRFTGELGPAARARAYLSDTELFHYL